jgi:hypothetical protein
MQSITTLFVQLCGQYPGKQASTFCGKVVARSLHSGNTDEESEELVRTLITVSILGRLHGDRLRKVRELCPVLYFTVSDIIENEFGIDHGVSLDYFFNRVLEIE